MNVLADQSLLFPGNRRPSLTLYKHIWYLHLDLYIVVICLYFINMYIKYILRASWKISYYICHYLYTLNVVTLVKKSLYLLIPDDSSIFTAEAKAIDLALDFISTCDANNKFIIFSDSLSVLKAMNHTSSKYPQI